jgi:hypothetical protein
MSCALFICATFLKDDAAMHLHYVT